MKNSILRKKFFIPMLQSRGLQAADGVGGDSAPKGQEEKQPRASGGVGSIFWVLIFIFAFCILHFAFSAYAQDIKEPNVAGDFYPRDPGDLSRMIETFFKSAAPRQIRGEILVLISPHAGYEFSGQTAAFGYKLIKEKPYKTIVIIGSSHSYRFRGISVYSQGAFRTPLGNVRIDEEFAQKLLNNAEGRQFLPGVFETEHSLEVQIPFLQECLSDFKIVPVLMGEVDFKHCQSLAKALIQAIGERSDILIVASTDMYHGYDYQEAEIIDALTLSYLKELNPQVLYNKLISGTVQLCGGVSVVSAMIVAKELGFDKFEVLDYTNSAKVKGLKIRGIKTVGYFSGVIYKDAHSLNRAGAKGEEMLNKEQRKKLLNLARQSIEHYLNTGKKLEVFETDPLLLEKAGAFVTLHKQGRLQGCIGNYGGLQPLYLTIRDMAVEAAVNDPRSLPLKPSELKDVEIEISVLSPLKKVKSADEIILGTHGVQIRRGFRGGVYLPQVATETGWSKEEFLSHLCAEKAGFSPDAWKQKDTEIYVFTAEVFSEKDD